jgi:3-oxoacyl-[acyl-carrier-protein] synthase II
VAAAVVGVGMVTPVGDTFESTWKAVLAGASGIAPITRFNAEKYPVKFGAEVKRAGSGLALASEILTEALAEAMVGVDLSSVPAQRIGVYVGAEAARPALSTLAHQILHAEVPTEAEIEAYLPKRWSGEIAERVGAKGPRCTYSVACTSSGQAIAEALYGLRRGEVDVAIVAGVDLLVHPLMVTGFSRLGALSTRNDAPSKASRPFDIDRDGFVLGEGAGVMVLTTKMKQPDIGPLQGWVLGAGITSNAWRITDSPPQGRGAMAAMLDAVSDAGVTASEVVYVNAHGTSTAQNDRSEAQAISAAFGRNGPLVSSTKSTMGHLVAACGVVEALITMRAVSECIAPPTANLENPDPECPVRHVPIRALALPRGVGISNAFGFGGTNASVVMAAP